MKIREILSRLGGRKNADSDSLKLRDEYNMLLERLSDIRCNFNFTDNPASIDALIYEENATLCRLQELYREARERGMKLEAFYTNPL